ncbi:hypothetical protein DITRI_Ditri08aG0080300 [Diplodiscus trichospermus]
MLNRCPSFGGTTEFSMGIRVFGICLRYQVLMHLSNSDDQIISNAICMSAFPGGQVDQLGLSK